MTESLFYNSIVRPRLGRFGILRRIENRIGEGTPDVLYTLRRRAALPAATGFIELKKAEHWPTGKGTPLRFNHFSVGQVAWMEEWASHGGRVCVLAQVEDDYLLVPPEGLRRAQAGVPRTEFVGMCAVVGRGVFPTAEVVRWLTR